MNELIGKSVHVLDDIGFVELQEVMGSDLSIINAARTSYMGESKGDEQDKRLLFYLMRNRHTSPFEMAEMRFRLRMPLVCWWQIVRHRTGNFNLQSGRYTEFDEDQFYIPNEWRLQAANGNKQMSDGLLDKTKALQLELDMTELSSNAYKLYEKAIKMGVAREQARLFLPGFAVYYTGIVKFDLHNLLHMVGLRNAPEAQYEIRVFVQTMYEEFVKPCFPWVSEAFELYSMGQRQDSVK